MRLARSKGTSPSPSPYLLRLTTGHRLAWGKETYTRRDPSRRLQLECPRHRMPEFLRISMASIYGIDPECYEIVTWGVYTLNDHHGTSGDEYLLGKKLTDLKGTIPGTSKGPEEKVGRKSDHRWNSGRFIADHRCRSGTNIVGRGIPTTKRVRSPALRRSNMIPR